MLKKTGFIQASNGKKYFVKMEEASFTTSSYEEAMVEARKIMEAFQNESGDLFEMASMSDGHKKPQTVKPRSTVKKEKKTVTGPVEDVYERDGVYVVKQAHEARLSSADFLKTEQKVEELATVLGAEMEPRKENWFIRLMTFLASFFVKGRFREGLEKGKGLQQAELKQPLNAAPEGTICVELQSFLEMEHLCFVTYNCPYVPLLDKVAQTWPWLSAEMKSSSQSIIKKALAILHCMEQDERDVEPGARFLNRYLPMIINSLEKFTALSKLRANTTEFYVAKELTQEVLNGMVVSFTKMHQQLLSNDVDDLVVTLKVMDQLRKSDGLG